MRKYKKYVQHGLLAVACTLGILSCNENETFDVMGNPNALFFFKENQSTNSFKFKIINTPESSSGDKIKVKVPVRSTRLAQTDITVTAAVNSSLVESYNSSHGTEYLAFPEELADMTKASVTIPAGSFISVDSLLLEVPENKSIKLSAADYLLPLKLTQASSGRSSAVKTSTIWVVVNCEYREIKDNMEESEIEGARVEEARSGWTASSPELSEDFSSIFDSNTATGVKFKGNGASIVIDIQKSHVLTGLCFSTGGNGLNINSMNVELSEDMVSWANLGSAISMANDNKSYQIIGFYPGKEHRARYIRLSDIQWNSNAWILGYSLREFSIYSPDEDFIINVEGVSLNKTELTLPEGETESLVATFIPQNVTNKKLTWTSDNPAIASVDEKGKVTAHQQGSTVITVKTDDGGKEAKCTVKVTKQAVNLFDNPSFEQVGEVIADRKYKDGTYWNVYNANKMESWGTGEPGSSIRSGYPQYTSEGNNSLILHTDARYLTQMLAAGTLKPNTAYVLSYDYWTSAQASSNGGAVYRIEWGTEKFGSDLMSLDGHTTSTATENKQSFRITFTTTELPNDDIWFTLHRTGGTLNGVDWIDNVKLMESSAE